MLFSDYLFIGILRAQSIKKNIVIKGHNFLHYTFQIWYGDIEPNENFRLSWQRRLSYLKF